LPADVPALAARKNQSLGLAQQKETNATLAVFGPPILVSFANAKRMMQQTLIHASCYKILMPDENFPEEPFLASTTVHSG
jgi:hypothetical protein